MNHLDLIKIGQRTLLCGDASERAIPPYGVNFKVRDRQEASTVLA